MPTVMVEGSSAEGEEGVVVAPRAAPGGGGGRPQARSGEKGKDTTTKIKEKKMVEYFEENKKKTPRNRIRELGGSEKKNWSTRAGVDLRSFVGFQSI